MEITILGSGGGSGIPNAFCQCANCAAARAVGGRSLRNGPAVLVNDDLLIDCGSDVRPSIRQLGLSLTNLSTLVITHGHSDHLDPWFFWDRRGVDATDLPQLSVYAPQDALDLVFDFFRRTVGWDPATLEEQTRTVWRPVRAGMMKLVGRYRLYFFPATHGTGEFPKMEAVLVGVRDVRAGYFHCCDTGPLTDAAWSMLAGHQFDAVALDACIGWQQDFKSLEHMSASQVIQHADRMRAEGILKPAGIALATHFVHRTPGTHDDLVVFYEPHGVTVAYDGLKLALGNGAS
jgi:phosphoribosyl 1,2-cyclic phosphate phosphodiesterase